MITLSAPAKEKAGKGLSGIDKNLLKIGTKKNLKDFIVKKA